MTAEEAKSYARGRLHDFGWKDSEFDSLEKLWEKESNWNYKAHNKKSGTLGIPQLKGAEKVPNFKSDYKTQVDRGLDYIKKREDYGTPSAAWNFHQKHGWY
jgi:hypothetical protein